MAARAVAGYRRQLLFGSSGWAMVGVAIIAAVAGSVGGVASSRLGWMLRRPSVRCAITQRTTLR